MTNEGQLETFAWTRRTQKKQRRSRPATQRENTRGLIFERLFVINSQRASRVSVQTLLWYHISFLSQTVYLIKLSKEYITHLYRMLNPTPKQNTSLIENAISYRTLTLIPNPKRKRKTENTILTVLSYAILSFLLWKFCWNFVFHLLWRVIETKNSLFVVFR